MNEAVLMIITAPNIEELMIDLLLEQPDVSGFTSHIVNAHGAGGIQLSMQEQVSGRQQKVQFMVYGTQSALQAFVGLIKAQLEHSGTRYILLPAIDSGVI
jgi:hypothetical protein